MLLRQCGLNPRVRWKGTLSEKKFLMSTGARERLRNLKAFPGATNVVVDGKNELEKILSPDIEDFHQKALELGKDSYKDPHTGLTILTRRFHLRRGRCCGNWCRHCPYNHVNALGAPPIDGLHNRLQREKN